MIISRLYYYSCAFLLAIKSKFYRLLINKQSGKFKVFGAIKLYHFNNITVGEGSVLNHGCILNARSPLYIGKHTHVSSGVIINTGGLDYSQKMNNRQHNKHPVKIGDGVWICSGAIVNPGVTIGDNSVIGAGAVVSKSIPANSVAVGVPAKVIKTIT